MGSTFSENMVAGERIDRFDLQLKLVPPHFKRVFGLRQVFGKASAENSIKYELSLTYIKTIAPGLRIFEIERLSPVYVNDTLPDSVADELATKTGSVFYPLQVYADFTGRFAGIHNAAEIADRWPALQIELQHFFTGSFAETYFNKMESVVSDPVQIENVLSKDLLINTIFQGIYKKYSEYGVLTEHIGFPLAGFSAPLLFEVQQKVDPYINESGQIEILRKGNTIDERTIPDVLAEDDRSTSRDDDESLLPVEGNYVARYAINRNTGSIEAMEAEWILFLPEEEKFSVSLYEIKEEVKLVKSNQQSFII